MSIFQYLEKWTPKLLLVLNICVSFKNTYLEKFGNSFVWFYFRQCLTLYSRLARDSLCSQDLLNTCRNSPVLASQVPGLQTWITLPGLRMLWDCWYTFDINTRGLCARLGMEEHNCFEIFDSRRNSYVTVDPLAMPSVTAMWEQKGNAHWAKKTRFTLTVSCFLLSGFIKTNYNNWKLSSKNR